MTYWKVLDGHSSVTAATYRYPGKGRWTKHLDPAKVKACEYGYHLARDEQVFDWLNGPTLWRAEPCPDHPVVDAGDKVVTCRVRLIERIDLDDRRLRLFAVDCAERALLRERDAGREPDARSWAAVEAARRFADGEISREDRDAAWDAAGDAAWDAAGDAAGDAAWAAAWAAAWDAARAAVRAAERTWQYRRFCELFGLEA